MDIEVVRHVLIWSFVINVGILMLWFGIFWGAREWLYGMHGRWFRLSPERFDFAHYLGMSIYKVGNILFNFVPWIALHIVA
ncbi:DUF6868 family protein [Phycisphaerales bacterium AB-hyl4]|uniref:DUF6868 family protein n=1 Tax=Natronomicrosphaera hydrolytica TaxID=3242702 RepID=A0ABV4U7Q8_9BACT